MTEQELQQLASLIKKAQKTLSKDGVQPEFVFFNEDKLKGYTPFIASGGEDFFSLLENNEVEKVSRSVY